MKSWKIFGLVFAYLNPKRAIVMARNSALIFFLFFICSFNLRAETPPPLTPAPFLTPTSKFDRKAIPVIQKSSVFKKSKSVHSSNTFTLKTGRDLETPFLLRDKTYYDHLNDDLSASFKNPSPTPTSDQKIWGTLAGIASYSCAGIAAAQSLGVIPSGKNKDKKQ